jgi:hypothetical protein
MLLIMKAEDLICYSGFGGCPMAKDLNMPTELLSYFTANKENTI